ncbi:MAG: protein kinase, partial [Thermoguttaceae bacterium]|nr:protein kinase [Thermoguttaceae bacterium]
IAQYFGSSRLTGANQVVGTIEFMAPEQAQAGPLTPRTDVYALGALLYALLTGSPPYRARTLPELLRRHREETPDSIRRARPEAPNVLDAFLRELLQILPEKRPGDARLVGRRLEGILKTASNLKNGNPFLNYRFFIDGTSELLSDDEASAREAQTEREPFDDWAPDIPYRALGDELREEEAKSPFEQTTEVNVAEDSEENDFGTRESARKATATLTTVAETTANDDFELADVAEPNESADFDAAVAFETRGGSANDFQASTEATIGDEARKSGDDALDAEATVDGAECEKEDGDDWDDVEASPLEKFKKSHFVSIDERELDALPQRAEKSVLSLLGKATIGAVALFGVVFLLAKALQRPSADELYERIENELRVSDADFSVALGRAEDDLRKMTAFYPEDPRSETARGYLARLEAETTERRLERRFERRRRDDASGPIERAYFDALRVAERDPDVGVVKLTALIALWETQVETATEKKSNENDGAEEKQSEFLDAFLGVARRRLERLIKERDKARADDVTFIAERWAAAVALAETDRAAAAK